jgi:hypothetical protein
MTRSILGLQHGKCFFKRKKELWVQKGAREPTWLYRLAGVSPGLDRSLQPAASISAAAGLLDLWVCPYLFNCELALGCNSPNCIAEVVKCVVTGT